MLHNIIRNIGVDFGRGRSLIRLRMLSIEYVLIKDKSESIKDLCNDLLLWFQWLQSSDYGWELRFLCFVPATKVPRLNSILEYV